jgi:hypothetical protein
VLNARYLAREGYGDWAPTLDDAAVVRRFVEGIPRFAEALSRYTQDENREVLSAVDGFLDRIAAGIE